MTLAEERIEMDWLSSAWNRVQAPVRKLLPAADAVLSVKEFMSDAVAARIRGEAKTRAYEMLAKTHRRVLVTTIVQNAALMASAIPVYYLHSPWPFYATYAGVAGHSIYSAAKAWPLLRRIVRTRSFTAAISQEVQSAIEAELTERDFIERKAVEWLGPDLKSVADDIARYLRPDIVAAAANMALTLVLAFVAFRLCAIPMLEHRALG